MNLDLRCSVVHFKHVTLLFSTQRRDRTQSHSVCTQVFPTLVEESRGQETLKEPSCSSEPPSFGSQQNSTSTQAKNSDRLDDTGAETKPGTTGGQPDKYKQTEDKHVFVFSILRVENFTQNKQRIEKHVCIILYSCGIFFINNLI